MANPYITVINAVYASNNMGIDVTSQVENLISGGNDDITANNTNFGDPDNGAEKYFFIWYSSPSLNGGNPIGLACGENQSIDLIPVPVPPGLFSTSAQPSLAASSVCPIMVTRAVYGTPNNGFDVTAICQALLNQGGMIVGQSPNPVQVSLPINNTTFGGDPDYGNTKYFAIEYSNAGQIFYLGGEEGQTLTLTL